MEINYDKEADALYIELREGEFSYNKKINPYTIVDFDKQNNILGIEIIMVSKTLPKNALKNVHLKNLAIA